MKKLFYFSVVLLLGVLGTSCKQDVEPTLIVTAEDTLGNKLSNLTVLTHPCFFNQDNCDTARLNIDFKKEKLSDASGQVVFEFPRSAVLDVIVIQAQLDDNGDTARIRIGHNVVAIETKELKKDEKNEYETTVIIDQDYQ